MRSEESCERIRGQRSSNNTGNIKGRGSFLFHSTKSGSKLVAVSSRLIVRENSLQFTRSLVVLVQERFEIHRKMEHFGYKLQLAPGGFKI